MIELVCRFGTIASVQVYIFNPLVMTAKDSLAMDIPAIAPLLSREPKAKGYGGGSV